MTDLESSFHGKSSVSAPSPQQKNASFPFASNWPRLRLGPSKDRQRAILLRGNARSRHARNTNEAIYCRQTPCWRLRSLTLLLRDATPVSPLKTQRHSSGLDVYVRGPALFGERLKQFHQRVTHAQRSPVWRRISHSGKFLRR